MPSIGVCATPSTILASGMPAASRIVGPTSMHVGELAAQRLVRLDAPGQETTMPLRVPPRWLAACLPHWKGQLPAQAQADA